MKLFKKFFLALLLVGLISSLGYSMQVKASEDDDEDDLETIVLDVKVDENNKVTWSWAPEDEEETQLDSSSYLKGSYEIYVSGYDRPIAKDTIPSKLRPSTADDLSSSEIQEVAVEIDKKIKSKIDSLPTLKGTVTVKLTDPKVGTDAVICNDKESSDEIVPWFKVEVGTNNATLGYASIKNQDGDSSNPQIVRKGDTVTLTAGTIDGTFSKWTGLDGIVTNPKETTQTVKVTSAISATATFSSGNGGDNPSIGGYAKLSYSIYDENNKFVKSGYVTRSDSTIQENVKKGYRITFTSENGDVYNWASSSNEKKLSDLSVTIQESGKSFTFYTKATTSGYNDSSKVTFVSEASTFKETKISIVGETYMTTGYEIEFYTKIETEGDLYKDNVTWEVTDGKGSFSSSTTKYDKDNKDNKTKLKYTGDDPKVGETAKIKIRAYIPKAKNGTDAAEATAEITVYPKNTLTFSSSEFTLTSKAPAKVNTGVTDGQESDNKDNTKTAISEVKGIKLQLFSGDTSLGTTSTAKDKGTSYTVDKDTVINMLNSVSTKLSGDSASLKFRAYPCDSDAKYNKNVYNEASTTVYRVEITYTKADGTTATEVIYGFEGQEIDLTKITALKNATIEEDGKQVTKFKVSSSASNNKKTAVLGASKAAADGTGLDKVPKTGQNNVFVYVMVAIVACAVCGGLYVYNKKTKNV